MAIGLSLPARDAQRRQVGGVEAAVAPVRRVRRLFLLPPFRPFRRLPLPVPVTVVLDELSELGVGHRVAAQQEGPLDGLVAILGGIATGRDPRQAPAPPIGVPRVAEPGVAGQPDDERQAKSVLEWNLILDGRQGQGGVAVPQRAQAQALGLQALDPVGAQHGRCGVGAHRARSWIASSLTAATSADCSPLRSSMRPNRKPRVSRRSGTVSNQWGSRRVRLRCSAARNSWFVCVPDFSPVALLVVFALDSGELLAQFGDSLPLFLKPQAGGLAFLDDELDEPGLGQLLQPGPAGYDWPVAPFAKARHRLMPAPRPPPT